MLGGSIIVQGGAWFVDQVLLISGSPMPSWVWVLISWGHAVLLALPIVPLALLTRDPRLRAAYQAWAAAILAIAVLALARVYPISWSVPAALTQIGLSLLLALGLAWRLRGRGPKVRPAGQLAALAVVPLVVFPLLLWGSLGSLLDTVLNLLAGLGLGLLAGILLDGLLFQPLRAQPPRPGATWPSARWWPRWPGDPRLGLRLWRHPVAAAGHAAAAGAGRGRPGLAGALEQWPVLAGDHAAGGPQRRRGADVCRQRRTDAHPGRAARF